MAIRLSGLTSGMDTDAIVQELVSAYSLKTQKYEKAQTKLTWKQDIWKELNTKIYSLYTNVSNLRYSTAYNLRKTTVSDNTKATVTASSDAVTGTQTLKINKTAQASYITGGKIGTNIDSTTKMSELGYTGDETSIKVVKNDGTTEQIKITKTTTVNDVVAQFKEAGLNANFDVNNQRFFISAKESGAEANFNLVGDTEDGYNALTALGLNTPLVEEVEDAEGNVVKKFTASAGTYAKYYAYYKAAQSATDKTYSADYDGTLAYMKDLMSKYRDAVSNNETLATERTQLKNANTQLDIEYATLEEQLLAKRAYNRINTALSNEEFSAELTRNDVRDLMNALGETEFYEKDADGNYVTDVDGNKIVSTEAVSKLQEAYEINHPGVTLDNTDLKTFVDVLSSEENVGYYATYTAFMKEHSDVNIREIDGNTVSEAMAANREEKIQNETRLDEIVTTIQTNTEFIEANSDMETILSEAENDDGTINETLVLTALADYAKKAMEAANIYDDSKYLSGSAKKIEGCDAEIELNGVIFTSSTNSFSINGLTINAMAETGNETITITTNVDTQGIYDKIKDFLTEYNNVINEMTKLYNAESASDYEPLTDEEKEAMSDEQIEKWETKIKDSLLRRDSSLNSVMSGMVNAMAQTYTVNGVKLSLSSFGISTLGFLNAAENEHYAYHIDGDEDDENTSGKDDKLMKAIQEDPDQLLEFMKQLASGLYTSINDKMKSTELSSAYKVYNDKEMDSDLADYAEMIAKWEEKVSDKEEFYYNKFSQMEVALSKLQNQTSSISGLLGS